MNQIDNLCINRALQDDVLLNNTLVLDALLLSERRTTTDLPSSNFFDTYQNGVQNTEIKEFMRKIVANWMLEVRLIFCLQKSLITDYSSENECI